MISVIIPTCNRNDLLSICLDAIDPKIQSVSVDTYEVIVTDDSQLNIAKNLIEEKYKWVKWVEGPKKGPAANRNNGAENARGQWLIFIDDDCIPDRNILKEYLYNLSANNSVLVFEGATRADREQQNLIEESPINISGGYLWSCNFMIHKRFFFNALQGFDERFPYASMEDVDLAYRIQKQGIQIMFLKNAFVIHPWRQQKEMYAMTWKRFHSTLYFVNKHPERKKDINSYYFLRLFYNGFVKNTLRNALQYRFKGIFKKLVYDFLQIYFALYVLVIKDQK